MKIFKNVLTGDVTLSPTTLTSQAVELRIWPFENNIGSYISDSKSQNSLLNNPPYINSCSLHIISYVDFLQETILSDVNFNRNLIKQVIVNRFHTF